MAGTTGSGREDTVVGAFRAAMASLEQAQHRRAALTATASSPDRLVTAVVNADGVLIEVRLAEGVEELSRERIAAAVVATTQAAATDVKRRAAEVVADFRRTREEFRRQRGTADVPPRLGELSDALRDLPQEPMVSMAPPDSPERSGSQQTGEPVRRSGPFEQSW